MQKARPLIIGTLLVFIAVVLGVWLVARVETPSPQIPPSGQPSTSLKKVVINEAVRTLLYLPLYHAIEKNYFRDEGIQVDIVTGGTATNSFAAMLSGEADFSQADPMYVPISREKGGKTKIVAQVVGRIALWGLTMSPDTHDMSAASLRDKKISTQPRPMTAYTYTVMTVRDAGLTPEKDVEIIQSQPGTEIIPLLNNQADFAVTLEPSTSIAVSKGAHVVLSYPKLYGDQVFTGLMTREEYIKENYDTVIKVVRAYQKSLTDLHTNPESAIESAKKYFPQLDGTIVASAVRRMVDDQVFPLSVLISNESWDKAIAVRMAAGDLKSPASRKSNLALDVMEAVIKK